jgi:cell division septation protein DedD
MKVNELYVQEKLKDKSENLPTEKKVASQKNYTSLYPFSLHVGSYHTIEGAKRAVAQMKDKEISAYWVKVDLKEKGIWYRIFTGFFKDRQEAERFREEHELTDANIKNIRYANLIGTYKSLDELNEKILLLKTLDYSPVVITAPDGIYYLYVGAFYEREMAEKQYEDLISDNIQNQIVTR